nr:MAG TPA: hypothetical protein [Caudoviricetes sp.]
MIYPLPTYNFSREVFVFPIFSNEGVIIYTCCLFVFRICNFSGESSCVGITKNVRKFTLEHASQASLPTFPSLGWIRILVKMPIFQRLQHTLKIKSA